jgi:lambda family phage portal protein
MNWLDRMIAAVAPASAVRRQQARRQLAVLGAYDAATPSRLRKYSRDTRSGEALARLQAPSIRQQARELDRNHDLASGALTVLVNNIVGPGGIGIEPQPRSVSGEILDDLAARLLELWRDWCQQPEVTGQHSWASAQRLACRTWLRDGECFAQIVEGTVAKLDHRTLVPLSLELIEADQIPADTDLAGRASQAGIVRNGWGRPTAYRVLKAHPGDTWTWSNRQDFKTIPADSMLHLRLVDRIGQCRGVSVLASVITRLEDLKDYEESERIAAKIAASMAAFIRKGTPDLYGATETEADGTTPAPRDMRFRPGMIFDDLMPGEDIGTIDSTRPNTGLQAYRDGQLRAVAGGIGASYSSVSRNYNGTYSAQRQELVEQWVHYQALAEHFTAQWVRPVWQRFVALAVLSGAVELPGELQPETLDDALFVGQTMPWIDPQKEAQASEILERNRYVSAPEIIRRRGGNPRETIQQQAAWQRMLRESGLDRQPPAAASPAPASPEPSNDGADPAEEANHQTPGATA